jgi:uncharacterized membrane protein
VRTRAQITIPGRISEAEALWYDTRRWPTFIDGFHHVAKMDPGWPAEGTLIWDSTPGGRGRVLETVVRYEARVGQTVEVEDEQITGTQRVAFAARADDRIEVSLELDYRVKERRGGPLFAVVDVVFIRPRQREALARTLARFSRELAADRQSAAP